MFDFQEEPIIEKPIHPRAANIKFQDSPKGLIPYQFQNSVIAGKSKKLIEDINDAPACFCNKTQLCSEHTMY